MSDNNKVEIKNKINIFRIFKNIYFHNEQLSRLFIIFIIVLATASIIKSDKFLTIGNFQSMGWQIPELGLLSMAIMLAMISGGIDLSVVGIANLAAVVVAKMLVTIGAKDFSEWQIVLGIIGSIFLGIVVGAICGLINGNLISRAGISPILATIGSMQLFTGMAIIITAGKSISGLPPLFSEIGGGKIFGFLPNVSLIFVLAAIIIGFLMSKTRYGLSIYMLGTNPIAAKFSGLNNTRLLNLTYMYSGILASISGLVILIHYNSAKADYGSSYTLQAILIVILAGTDYRGGFGSISGVVIAILTLQVASSTLNMFPDMSVQYKTLVWGFLLIIAMIFNSTMSSRKTRSVLKGN